MKDTQRRIEVETGFLVAMSDLIMAMRDLLYRFEDQQTFLLSYSKTLERIESKIDTISIQTIKSEYVKGTEDYLE